MLRDVQERAELIKKSLQRLYNEIDRLPASEGYFLFDKYVERYNIILSDAKKIFSDKRLIQEQKEIDHPPDRNRMGAFESQILPKKYLVDVKLNTLLLMDILDVSVMKEQISPHQIIYVNQIQNTEQLINISIESLIESIQQQNIDIQLKENAAKAIEEFEEEIKKENPEPSKIKKCIDSVLKVGKEFAVPLLFKIIENWDKIFKGTN